MKDQVVRRSDHKSAEDLKDVWVTPEMSDYEIDALTEASFLGAGADAGLYS